MTQNASFIRKIVYVCIIVALLFPLFLLGQPTTKTATGRSSAGGKLARLRIGYGLSQAELGKIDPASETMKMATLGLRGVATNLLWTRANRYKRTESWDKLSATLNQIAKLQPNYITVWEFQAHNLSYNVSAEFDNYQHRYHWVKRGIKFLIEGTRYNQRNPRLFWNLGWFCCQKLGRADEHEQFRRMFRTDTDFHEAMDEDEYISVDNARGPDGKPDNWLVGHAWYLKAHEVVDTGVPTTWLRLNPDMEGLSDKRRSSVIFYSDPSMALINHADAITEETTPGEKTRNAWRRASESWARFGNMDVPTSYGHTIRLNDLAVFAKQRTDALEELEAMSPGMREKLREERLASLTEKERAVLNESPGGGQLSQEQMEMRSNVFRKTVVTEMDVAKAMPQELRARALQLALDAIEAGRMAQRISTYAGVVNYEYWLTRCEVEQAEETAEARKHLMLADKAAADGDPEGARDNYEKAWDIWKGVFDKYPQLIGDVMADDLRDVVMQYRRVLEQLDEEFPSPFKLEFLVEEMRTEAGEETPPGFPGGPAPPPGGGQKAADDKPSTKGDPPKQ